MTSSNVVDLHPTETLSLDDLKWAPRWVPWRAEDRNGEVVKRPYNAHTGGRASTSDPATWSRRRTAETWAKANRGNGVGIVLGDIGGVHVGGVDLDACRDPDTGDITPWAQEVIDRLGCYTEISPSETGVKVFFQVPDAPAIMKLLKGKQGTTFRSSEGKVGNHAPGIEFYIGGRYFTTTGKRLSATDELCVARLEGLKWIIRDAGPKLAGKHAGKHADNSPSGKAFHLALSLRGVCKSCEDLFDALINADDPEIVEWVNKDGKRGVQLIWDKIQDGRRQYPAPANDGEKLPVMIQIDEALASSDETFPPMRNLDDAPITITKRAPLGLHELTSESANADEGDERNAAAASLSVTPHDTYSLALEIERYACFCRTNDEGKSRSVALPKEFVVTYMAYRESTLPRIGALLTLPLVLPDGRLISRTGLHPDLNVAMQTDADLARILTRKKATPGDAARALKYLTDEWLTDVTTSHAGKCVAVAAALTVIERALLKERPCFWVTAGKRAGGKTTLLNMIAAATTGSRANAMAWSTGEEERRKALFSALLQQPPLLVFDNIKAGSMISCPHVERALTSERIEDRVLGRNEIRSALTSTITFFTGNNVGPKGDLASRSLMTRIEVDRPDPENREFKRKDPIGWTLANRADILDALYIILQGLPVGAGNETRFKEWYRIIGGRVEQAAQINGEQVSFAALFAEMQTADEDEVAIGDALQVLREKFDDEPFTAVDVFAMFNDDDGDAETLKEVLTPDVYGRPSKKALTWALKRIIGAPTVLDSGEVLTLRKVSPDTARVITYRVEQRMLGHKRTPGV
jgi:hypothetical protein